VYFSVNQIESQKAATERLSAVAKKENIQEIK
jgi:hypothetical protein